MPNDRLVNATLLLVCVSATFLTGLAVRRTFAEEGGASRASIAAVVLGGPIPAVIADSTGHREGAATPAVTVTVYEDFQCPFCAVSAGALRQLLARFPDQLAVVSHHLPLTSIHRHAFDAAVAAECAGDQGRYAEFATSLYEAQDSIGSRGWTDFARGAGVPDTAAFSACLTAERPRNRVAGDTARASALGLTSTPSLFIDGAPLLADPTPARLDSIVVARVGRTR